MVHSHVIRTMNLLTIDARKKRPKLRIFIKEKFWSHQNIAQFSGKDTEPPRFLYLVGTLRVAISIER